MKWSGLLDKSNCMHSHRHFEYIFIFIIRTFYMLKYKVGLGRIRDQTAEEFIHEGGLLKHKMCSMKFNSSNKKCVKEITKSAILKSICHQNYLEDFRKQIEFYRTTMRIGSENHEIGTFVQTSIALSSWKATREWINVSITCRHYFLGLLENRLVQTWSLPLKKLLSCELCIL